MDNEARHRLSILQPVGVSAHSCGYCSEPGSRSAADSSVSFGLVAHTLSAEAYQRMIDHGWRRSGNYVYRPDMAKTCCPQYTIRLDARTFKPSKAQRSAVNRFARFVRTGDLASDAATTGKGGAAPHDYAVVLSAVESDPSQRHRFRTVLEPASFSQAKFELYARYQVSIHHGDDDKPSVSGFTRFLCESPIEIEPNGTAQPYGSFHELYYLDDKLIALAVLDILPACVSSVYFVYDPDLGPLGLGKISAMRECARAASLAATLPRLHCRLTRFDMGYYIHTCAKMRYKAEYAPSELLDPSLGIFVPFEHCKSLLDVGRRVTFAATEDEAMATDEDEDEVPAPGFLDPEGLPTSLIAIAIVLERNTLVPATKSRAWQNGRRNRELRELLGALGPDVLQAGIVAYVP